MTWAIPRPGLHVTLDGREFPLDADASGWYLWSSDERDRARGFVPRRPDMFAKPVQEGDHLDVWERSYRGTYRGLGVDVVPNAAGGLMLVSKDPAAPEAGFERFDRGSWASVVPPDDPDLSFEEIRNPASPRWGSPPQEAS